MGFKGDKVPIRKDILAISSLKAAYLRRKAYGSKKMFIGRIGLKKTFRGESMFIEASARDKKLIPRISRKKEGGKKMFTKRIDFKKIVVGYNLTVNREPIGPRYLRLYTIRDKTYNEEDTVKLRKKTDIEPEVNKFLRYNGVILGYRLNLTALKSTNLNPVFSDERFGLKLREAEKEEEEEEKKAFPKYIHISKFMKLAIFGKLAKNSLLNFETIYEKGVFENVIKAVNYLKKEKVNKWNEIKGKLYRDEIIDLSGITFTEEEDLRWVDLRCVILRGGIFINTDFRGADFEKADIRGTYFERVDFRGSNFIEVMIVWAKENMEKLDEFWSHKFGGKYSENIKDIEETLHFQKTPALISALAEFLNITLIDYTFKEEVPGFREEASMVEEKTETGEEEKIPRKAFKDTIKGIFSSIINKIRRESKEEPSDDTDLPEE